MTTARPQSTGPSRVLPTHFDETAGRVRRPAAPSKLLSELARRFWQGELSLLRAFCLLLGLSALMFAVTRLMQQRALHYVPLKLASGVSLLVLTATVVLALGLARGTWAAARTYGERHGGAWPRVAQAALLCELLLIYPWAYAADWMLVPEQLGVLFADTGPSSHWSEGKDETTLVLHTELGSDTDAQLEAALAKAPNVTTLQLDSDGGLVTVGQRLAGTIERHRLATHIEGRCSGACSIAFLAGHQRSMGAAAALSFQQVASGLPNPLRTYLTSQLYAHFALPDNVIAEIAEDHPWTPSYATLRDAGVLNK